MRVCCNSPWHEGKDVLEHRGVTFLFNQFEREADLVLDIKWPHSELSRLFPPARRVWLHVEPIHLTDYFTGFERYYEGGILSWHSGLECLPQRRRFRGCDLRGGKRDTDDGKVFGLGGHISSKKTAGMAGYRLRQTILDRQHEIAIPSLVFNHRGKWLNQPHDYPRASTDEVMHFMFHLAVENSREQRYFTEKIIGAFANMSVPIYFGDPDIGDEFDAGGIICIDETDWLDVINALTPADYYERMEAVRINYFRSRKYWDTYDQLADAIKTCPAARRPRTTHAFCVDAISAATAGTELRREGDAFTLTLPEGSEERVVKCNESAAAVFSLSDGRRTVNDIVQMIAENLDLEDTTTMQWEVSQTVRSLVENGMLEYAPTDYSTGLYPVSPGNCELESRADHYRLRKGKESIELNASAALIWSLCDGSRTIETITQQIAESVETLPSELDKDVYQAVFRLADQNLLTVQAHPRRTRSAPLDATAHRKPRVLMILTRFPQLSETYIKVEINALREEYDVKVVTFEDSNLRYVNHHPYSVVRVAGNTLGDDIDDDRQELRSFVEAWSPDVLHTHYLHNARVVGELAEKTGIPYTIRAHSYETMADRFRHHTGDGAPEPNPVLVRVAHLINRDECLGVLTFPYTVPAFRSAGIRNKKVIPCYPVVDFSAFYDRGVNGTGVLNVEPCLAKKAVTDFVDLAAMMPDREFDLYGMGHDIQGVTAYNESRGSPARIRPTVEPEEMPAVYKQHDWLVYTADFKTGNVGWPVAIFEAQAAGLGVCVANIHPHTASQLGGAGFVYDSVSRIPDIIRRPYPEELREKGYQNARKADIYRHKHLLTDLWEPVFRGGPA